MGPAVCLTAVAFAGCDLTLILVMLTLSVSLQAGIYAGWFINHIDIASNFAGMFSRLFFSFYSLILRNVYISPNKVKISTGLSLESDNSSVYMLLDSDSPWRLYLWIIYFILGSHLLHLKYHYNLLQFLRILPADLENNGKGLRIPM